MAYWILKLDPLLTCEKATQFWYRIDWNLRYAIIKQEKMNSNTVLSYTIYHHLHQQYIED